MTLYNQLQPKDAAIIITLANNGFLVSQISRETRINRNKIKRCLDKCEVKKSKRIFQNIELYHI